MYRLTDDATIFSNPDELTFDAATQGLAAEFRADSSGVF